MTLTATTADRQPWWTAAACRNVDPDLFHPERGESTAAAKAVCARCPVRLECLDWALTHHEKFGIWGGFSDQERRRIGYAPVAQRTRICVCCGVTFRPHRRDRDQPFCTPDCRRQHVTQCLSRVARP